MNNKNIFDVLANAEDDTMNRLTDKCPEITDAQLERLLARSERKYNDKKKEMDNMQNTRSITMTEYDEVSGVEKHRPAWIRTMCTAASVFLALGVVVGSVSFLKRGTNDINNGGESDPFAAVSSTAVSTTTGTGTGSSFTTASGETYTSVVAVEVTDAAASQTASKETTAPEKNSAAAPETTAAANTTAALQNTAADTDKYVKIAEELSDRFAYSRDHIYGGLQVSSDTVEFRNKDFDWEKYTPQPGAPSESAVYHKVADPNFPTLQSIRDYLNSTFFYEFQAFSSYLDSIDNYFGLNTVNISSADYPSISYVPIEFVQQLNQQNHFIYYDGELYVSASRFGGGSWIYSDKPTITEAGTDYFIATRPAYTDLNPNNPFVAEFVIANHGENGNDNWLITSFDSAD